MNKNNCSDNSEISTDEFDKILTDALLSYYDFPEIDMPQEPIEFSHRHKLRMNRIFRESGCHQYLPYPEVDNLFERTRSYFIFMLKKIFSVIKKSFHKIMYKD